MNCVATEIDPPMQIKSEILNIVDLKIKLTLNSIRFKTNVQKRKHFSYIAIFKIHNLICLHLQFTPLYIRCGFTYLWQSHDVSFRGRFKKLKTRELRCEFAESVFTHSWNVIVKLRQQPLLLLPEQMQHNKRWAVSASTNSCMSYFSAIAAQETYFYF